MIDSITEKPQGAEEIRRIQGRWKTDFKFFKTL